MHIADLTMDQLIARNSHPVHAWTFKCRDCGALTQNTQSGEYAVPCERCGADTQRLACERCGCRPGYVDDICFDCLVDAYRADPSEFAVDREWFGGSTWWAKVAAAVSP